MRTLPSGIDNVMGDLERQLSRSSSALEVASDELAHVFAAVAARVVASAGQFADAASAADMRTAAPVDLGALTRRLDHDGPETLSGRERRVLVASVGHLDARQLARVLDHSPALTAHAARACFTYWPSYVVEPWGEAYQKALSVRLDVSSVQLLRTQGLTAQQALARDVPGLETRLALKLRGHQIEQAYDEMKQQLGVRDSWLLSSSVLNAWLIDRFQRGQSLDGVVQSILQHERLRALLLPARQGSSGGPALRTNVAAQAQTVATFIKGAYSDPVRISRTTFTALIDYLLRSTFDDPRLPLRSEGWDRVKQLNETGFRRMLSALCEQDLEVFFRHAMEEPDRHRFWLQYLHEIERTGCVLDRAVRRRLDGKLERRPELHGALERAYSFSAKSDVQAFYLVFRSIVVVEFSKTGNAAYVYRRPHFEKRIEPGVRAQNTRSAAELKDQTVCLHRILHHAGGWQNDAAAWLASEGVHARPRF